MRSAIEQRATELRLNGCLVLTGALAWDGVLNLYASAAVVVLPSFAEGVPVVLMEAMACGRPVVATRVGGIPELVQHGVTGLLVAPGDAEELADALQWVHENPESAKALAENAARFVREQYGLESSVRRLSELFRQARESQKPTGKR